MPGPLPKNLATRQRRNKSSSRALLFTDTSQRIRAPKLPTIEQKGEDGKVVKMTWHPMAQKFWEVVWSSPMRFEYLRADEPSLFRLLYIVHLFWMTGDLEYAKEWRMLEREFGLTPFSRRRLEWQVVQTEEAKDKREEKRARRAVPIDAEFGDPRGVLES